MNEWMNEWIQPMTSSSNLENVLLKLLTCYVWSIFSFYIILKGKVTIYKQTNEDDLTWQQLLDSNSVEIGDRHKLGQLICTLGMSCHSPPVRHSANPAPLPPINSAALLVNCRPTIAPMKSIDNLAFPKPRCHDYENHGLELCIYAVFSWKRDRWADPNIKGHRPSGHFMTFLCPWPYQFIILLYQFIILLYNLMYEFCQVLV
jgi:hypothetical protein